MDGCDGEFVERRPLVAGVTVVSHRLPTMARVTSRVS